MSTLKIWLETKMALSREIMFSALLVLASLSIYLGLGTVFGYPFGWELLVRLTPYTAMIMVKNALGEEALFRLLPLLIFFAVVKDRKIAIVLFFIFSPLFAYLHIGLISLFVIGPISVLLTLAFLKFGGATGNHLRGFMFVGAIHAVTNFSIHSCARFLA